MTDAQKTSVAKARRIVRRMAGVLKLEPTYPAERFAICVATEAYRQGRADELKALAKEFGIALTGRE